MAPDSQSEAFAPSIDGGSEIGRNNYPPFDLRNIPTYTNDQLRYYHISGATLDVEEDKLKEQLEKRKRILELIGWNGDTQKNSLVVPSPSPLPHPLLLSTSRTLSFDYDSEADSECSRPVPGYKGIKFNASDITQLRYDSNVAQFNNWIEDLKSAFDGDPSKYPTSRQKIILASMTIDEQLKTTYNSTVRAHPAISAHWRKFKRWIQNVVLHGDSDRLKLSNEFTTARQRTNEDPNQFYLRLFNLGIQSGRSVDVEDYRTRLVKPLQNLINQQDHVYPTVQDAVAHAGRLWQTLDPDKVRQEIRDAREKNLRQRQRLQSTNPELNQQGSRQGRSQSNQNLPQSQGNSQRSQQSQRPQQGQQSSQSNRQGPKLSAEERQYRGDNDLCFNCGYSGHRKKECTYPFNPNRAPPRENNQIPQSSSGRKRPYAKVQATHASDDDEADSIVHMTDESDHEIERSTNKRQKN
jgi:hypothetical protein